MEDVLDIYEQPANPQRPRLCFDELPCQLLGDRLVPLEMRPGDTRKEDYDYERYGTCSLLLAYDIDRGKRYLQVRDQRTKADYAAFWDWLVTTHYPTTPKIQVIQDNLNTHSYGSFYEHLPAQRAHHLKHQLEFHFTPKHGSWLNMAEIEINMMDRECLARRIGDADVLEREITSWSKQRNKEKKKIQWSFTRRDADKKLSKYYVA